MRGLIYQTAILVFLILFLSAAIQAEERPYFLKHSWILPYGAGTNELGIEVKDESPRLGPCAFSAHNGKIYILDAVNSAIKVFSCEKGSVEKAIAGKGLTDELMIDRHDNLFLSAFVSAVETPAFIITKKAIPKR
jgi:hypothetical protein